MLQPSSACQFDRPLSYRAILDGKIGLAVNPGGIDFNAEAEYDYTVAPPMFNLRYSMMVTPFQKAAVMTLDGRGEKATTGASPGLVQAWFARRSFAARLAPSWRSTRTATSRSATGART